MLTIRKYERVTRYITIKKFIGRSLFNANAFQFEDVLFDSGINLGDDLSNAVRAPRVLCVTHGHHDHIGNNASLQKIHNVRIYSSEEAIPKLTNPDNSSLIEILFAGKVKPSYPLKCPEEFSVGDLKIRPIRTPGHSIDHMCYYLPEQKFLFSGDIVLWGTTKWVSDEVKIWDAIDSLEKLSELDLDTIFPGHGRPFTEPEKILPEKIAHLKGIGESAIDLYEKGWNEKRIRDKLLGSENYMAIISRGRFSKLNLIKSFLEGRSG